MTWEQLKALVWLRWRLSVNQWGRGGGVQAVLVALAWGMGLVIVVGGGILGMLLGATTASSLEPQTLRTVWDVMVLVFLLLWSMGVVMEIQRSEVIDLGRLLHLPVSLRGVFVMNYVASHGTFALAAFVPAAVGFAVGQAFGRGLVMGLLVPAVFAFLFMVTAWTYCLRGWLTIQMVNPRRRRALVMGVTLAFVLLFQLPNLLLNFGSGRRSGGEGAQPGRETREARRARLEQVMEWAHAVPPLWLPAGAGALAEGRVAPALAGTAGMALLGLAGLWRAHRSALRFYQGVGTAGVSRKPPPAVPDPTARRRPLLVERELPWVKEETAAIALTGFRAYARAPEVKMMLVLNLVVIAMLFGGIFLRDRAQVAPELRLFLPVGIVLFTFLGAIQLLSNQFGFDRDGFRSLVLSPVSRRDLLAGKNLAFLPIALATLVILVLLVGILTGLSLAQVLQSMALFVMAYCLISSMGNLASIVVPYRMAPGSLKATKTQALTSLFMILLTMTFPLFLSPILVPAGVGWLLAKAYDLPGDWIATGLAFLGAGLAVAGYRRILHPLGRLLQRRERDVLRIVTQEVE